MIVRVKELLALTFIINLIIIIEIYMSYGKGQTRIMKRPKMPCVKNRRLSNISK